MPNPADQLGNVQAALAGLIVVLALIGLASLLTASLIGQRDHQRDVGVLRAMGLTPLQVRVAVMMRTAVLALIAVAAGALAGRAVSISLISAISKVYGLGAGIGRPPSAGTLIAAIVLAIAVAVVAGILPSRLTSRLPAVAVLGP